MKTNNEKQSGLEAFLNAVNLLFHSEDKDMKVQANKFLVDFESKAESWDIAFQVLQKNDLSEEAYFNALNILKRKIRYDFGNYSENPEYINKLLSFLESNIDKYKKSKHYILINYCDCVGKAFLFTGDNFKSLLQKFTMKLYTQNADIESLICLLLIFNFICDTSFDKKMVIDDESRQKIKHNIENISGDVFQFLILMINKLNSLDANLKKFISHHILETINNYLYIHFDENVLLKFNDEYLPIVNFIFQIDEENLEKHSECICSLLYLPLQEENMKTLAQYIFSKILQFKDIFYKSINSLDDEQASFYVDVFTIMAKNNIEEILNEKRIDLIQIIVDLVKKCPPSKLYDIDDFLDFFYQYLLEKKISYKEIINNFQNLYKQLILNLINLTKFEDEIFNKLNKSRTKALNSNDEYNTTMDFRSSTKEILKNFLKYNEFSFIFDEILFPEFNKIVSKIKENPKNISCWCKMENLLYIFYCIDKDIDIEDKSFENVIILFHTFLDIPKEYIQIIRTVTDILDDCSNILYKNKELLFKGFKYLINGLDNDLTLKYCSVSAKKLLTKNKIIISELREDLLILYEQKLKNKILTNKNYLEVVEGLIQVITYSDNNNNKYEIIKNTIIEIMKSWVLDLQEAKKLIEKNNSLSPEHNEILEKLLIIIKSISKAAFEGLCENNKKIMYEILNEIWPIIIFILQKMSTNCIIVECIIQLIKVYMRGLNNNFIKFIPEYINNVINGYKLYPISSYLYAFEILVTVFPETKEQEIKLILNNTFNELYNITFNRYIKKEFDLNIYAEIGEDFFGMAYRIMKISPTILIENNMLINIINISLKYITTTQIEIAKNIIIFFQNIIKFEKIDFFKKMENTDNITYKKYKDIFQKMINEFSLLLCEKILYIYINSSVEQIIENLNELFKDFIIYQKTLVLKGMEIHLKNIPGDILTNKEKNTFFNLIDDFSVKEEEFNIFIDNFINRCISNQIRKRGQN